MKRVVFVVALGLLLCSCSNKVAKTEGKPYGVNIEDLCNEYEVIWCGVCKRVVED